VGGGTESNPGHGSEDQADGGRPSRLVDDAGGLEAKKVSVKQMAAI